MSFLVPRPSLQNTTAAQANQIPSFQGAQPMTLAYGRIPFQGARWISDAYNRHAHTAGSNKPEWNYADVAASFGIGRMDFVGKVRFNGLVVANLDHARTTEDYIDYTFNPALASGEAMWMRYYFGTETQTADASLIAGTGQNHPPYRGQAYAVFHNLDLGQGNTSLPSIEIECGRYTPAIDTFPAAPESGYKLHPYGVNPIAAIYGLLTSNYGGLGCDASLVDPVHWGAQAAALEATGIARRTGRLTYLHAVLTSFKDIASAVSEWLAYFDGYLYQNGGKLCIGWMPHAAVDPTTLPQITEADLTSTPSGGGFPDANAGLSDAVVTYLDVNREYTQQGATYRAPANRKTQIASSPQQIDRSLSHASDQASLLAAEAASSGTQQEPSTMLSVLRSRAVKSGGAPLMPGDLFNYDYNPEAFDLVCRVIERIETDPAGAVQLTVIRERGAFPTPHTPPIDDRVLPTPVNPGTIGTGDVRLWFLPSGFGTTRQVAALINRANREITGALLSLSPSGSAPWETIINQRWFPAKCAVGISIDGAATTLRVTSTSVDFARMAAQNLVAQVDDTLMALVGDELLSISAIAVVSSGVYDLTVLRGRQGTAAAAHTAADVGWVFVRAELAAATHNEFSHVRNGSNVYDATIATKYFKLALTVVDNIGTFAPADPGLALQLPDLNVVEAAGGVVPFVSGLSTSLGTEAATRAANDLAEVIARVAAISAEAATRLAADVAEANARAAAVLAEATARGAAITTEQTVRQAADDSLANSITTLTASVNSNAAAIAAEQTARANGDTALASSITILAATVTSNNTTLTAAVSTEQTARANGDTALANSITALTSTVNSNTAAIASESSTRASADSALSTSIASLSATVGGINSTVSTLSAAYIVGGSAIATWGFKLDANGKVVKMQAIAASSGTQTEVGSIIFGGATLQSDTFSAGTSGWQLKPNGDVEFNSGTFRGTLDIGVGASKIRIETATAEPGFFMGNSGAHNRIQLSNFSDGTSVLEILGADGGNAVQLKNNASNAHKGGQIGVYNDSGSTTIFLDGQSGYATVGALYVGGNQVVGARGASIAAAPTNAGPINAGTFAGSDTINEGTLEAHLNAVDTFINSLGARINDLNARLVAHGLIS